VFLFAFLYLWLKLCKGIDKYWIVPIRKLFYFHHSLLNVPYTENVLMDRYALAVYLNSVSSSCLLQFL